MPAAPHIREGPLCEETPWLHEVLVRLVSPAVRLLPLVALLGACRGPADFTLQGRARAPAVVFAAPPGARAPACHGALDVAELVARVRPSIVGINAGHASKDASLTTTHGDAREHAVGAGILITEDGLVLTSHHVIEDADDIRVELSDGRSLPGVVVARDKWLDVAIVRVHGLSGQRPAVLGSSEATRVGDPVITMGNPFGLGASVTRGILSAKARAVDSEPSEVFLQTDAPVNPGDSGGPLFDAQGQVIGINTAIIAHGQGVSFAVPIDDVRAALPELLATGRVLRGYAGITFQPVDAPLARALRLPAPMGAIVTALDPGGPAERAGLRAGDLIASVDGRPIRHAKDLAHALGRSRPGAPMVFEFVRDGRQHTHRVIAGRQRGEAEDGDVVPKRTAASSKGGAGLRTTDDAGGGARVEGVDPNTTAADELHPGDVVVEANRRQVKGAAELADVLASAPRPSTVLLRVRRAGEHLYVGLDLK